MVFLIRWLLGLLFACLLDNLLGLLSVWVDD